MHAPRTALAAVALLLPLALTGCSTGNTPRTPQATPAATATHGPGRATTVTVPSPSAPAAAPLTGPAADAFGAGRVESAYRFAATYLIATTFDPHLLLTDNPGLQDLAFVEDGLTPAAAASFHSLAAELASPTGQISAKNNSDLLALASYGLARSFPGHTVRAPGVRDVGYGPATTRLFTGRNGDPALGLYFPVTGTFLLTDPSGRPAHATYTKDMGLTLVPTADPAHPWLLDGWTAQLRVDGPVPDPSS